MEQFSPIIGFWPKIAPRPQRRTCGSIFKKFFIVPKMHQNALVDVFSSFWGFWAKVTKARPCGAIFANYWISAENCSLAAAPDLWLDFQEIFDCAQNVPKCTWGCVFIILGVWGQSDQSEALWSHIRQLLDFGRKSPLGHSAGPVA